MPNKVTETAPDLVAALQRENALLHERVTQFDKAIRRIVDALDIGEACAGVDTDDNGGHTAQVIERHALDLRSQKQAPEAVAALALKHGLSTGHAETLEDLLAELDWQLAALQRENEELRKDVERFAIVRKRIPSALARAFTMDDTPMSDDALNAAIDAALRQQTEQQGNSDGQR